MIRLLPGVVAVVLWLFCVVDVASTAEHRVRNLSKVVWLLLVLFFPLVGSVAWLVAGRPQRAAPPSRARGAAPGFPEYERPGRMAAADPAADEAFLRQVRARAEEQRRRYDEERRRRAGEEQSPDEQT